MAHAPYPYMLSGNLNGSPPVNSIGAEGNYFFDESNGNIWGPKTNGVWPSPPATPAYPGGGGSPGGTDGQVQWNNGGAFDGFTVSGDGTLVTSTGVLTVTSSGGVAFGSAAFAATTAFDAAGTATAAVSAFAATLGSLAYLNTINNSNWSGTVLSVANGGTGTSTPSLVAGTNVTITGTWPNQTINASGGGGGSPGGDSGQYQYNDSGSFGGIGRILFADTTFYAADDGDELNTGLSALSPWPQQYMFDQMAFVDANGFGVTLQSADGSYAAAGTNQCFSVLYRPRNAAFFKIYGNTTTPDNCLVDGIDGTPLGFAFGQNADTGAIAKVLVDEFGGFHVKNAACHTSLVTGSSLGNLVNSKSEDNYEGFVVRQYSTVGDVAMTYAGNHGVLLESDTGIINSWTPTFETGATCDDTVFIAAVYGYLGCGDQDYTNLDATLAIQYFVDNFGFLDADGNAAGIPGAAGDVAPFGAVN